MNDGDERKQITRNGQDESQERKEDQQDDRLSSIDGKKIGREKLIESKRERFGIELTLST